MKFQKFLIFHFWVCVTDSPRWYLFSFFVVVAFRKYQCSNVELYCWSPPSSSHDPVSLIKSALGFYGQNYKMVFFRHGHNMWGTGIVETHSNSVPSRDGATSCCVLVLAVINAGHTRGRGWDTWDRSQCARCLASPHLTLLARCRDQVCPGFLSPLELQMKVREDFTITEKALLLFESTY